MPTRNQPIQVTPDDRSLAAGPKRIVWQITNIASRDGHELNTHFSATAMLSASAADTAMIRETFHVEPSLLTADTVRDHFVRTVEPAIFNHLNRHEAADFDDGHEGDLACETVAKALQVAGFAAGVRFVPPFALTIESPSRQRQALETAARTRAADALAHATSTMQQFQRLRDQQPEASLDHVLEQVGPAASESLLPTLLRGWAEQKPASRIVVASGDRLTTFSRDGDAWRAQPTGPALDIGPLRCVLPLPVPGERERERAFALPRSKSAETKTPSPQPSPGVQGKGDRFLLVGGQRGAAVVTISKLSTSSVYRLPADRLSSLGLNHIAVGASHLFATHSEFGLFVWPIDSPESPRLFEHPQARFATMIDATHCLFVAGTRLVWTDGDITRELATPTAASILALLSDTHGLQIIFADGTIGRLSTRQDALHVETRLGGSITQVTPIDWLGERRLLVANDRGEIECVGATSRVRILSSHAGWRKIAAAADLIVALSLDRTRLVLWQPWEPERPLNELHVASLTQHRVSDVALIEATPDDLSG